MWYEKKLLISVTLSEMNIWCVIAVSNPLTQNQSTILYIYVHIYSIYVHRTKMKERKEKGKDKKI